ncbi:hypothetical protein ABZ756_13650 [Mammaliicoccus sciuri]
MNQINFDDYLNGKKELILCRLTSDYYWIRITNGHTPPSAVSRVHFLLNGYDYLYEDASGKEEILNSFDGDIKKITWEEGMG